MTAELLQKLGVYIDAEFLSAKECEDICAEIGAGAKSATPLYSESTKTNSHIPAMRQSLYSEVPDATRQSIATKVKHLQPVLETHFSDRFHSELETPKFVSYEPGHFFAPHTDGQLRRKINMSIYLNDEDSADAAGDYSGGTLILYGLFKNPAMATKGVRLQGQQGMLVAYPSETVHEVTPVTRGVRHAIISRYFDARA